MDGHKRAKADGQEDGQHLNDTISLRERAKALQAEVTRLTEELGQAKLKLAGREDALAKLRQEKTASEAKWKVTVENAKMQLEEIRANTESQLEHIETYTMGKMKQIQVFTQSELAREKRGTENKNDYSQFLVDGAVYDPASGAEIDDFRQMTEEEEHFVADCLGDLTGIVTILGSRNDRGEVQKDGEEQAQPKKKDHLDDYYTWTVNIGIMADPACPGKTKLVNIIYEGDPDMKKKLEYTPHDDDNKSDPACYCPENIVTSPDFERGIPRYAIHEMLPWDMGTIEDLKNILLIFVTCAEKKMFTPILRV